MSEPGESGATTDTTTEETVFGKHETVTISLNGSGALEVQNQDPQVEAAGLVTFKIDATLTHFVIVMKTNDTPMKGNHLWVGGTRAKEAKAPIASNANGTGTKKYPYSILASDGSDTYYLDPEIIVGPQT